MNAICLVIDRLNAGYLGYYGNAWVGTPAFDRLAAESFVLDGAYIDSPELDSFYDSYWLGSHALARGALTRSGAAPGDVGRLVHPSECLPGLLSAAGVATALVTDAPEVANHPLAAAFAHREEVPTQLSSTQYPRRAASELEETHTARFFAAALDALAAAKPPFLLWLHSQGMAGPWDAPRELRERYAAEGDPAPPDFVQPPAMRLPHDPDPDELLGIRQAYAAQVAVVDACVAALHDALRAGPRAGDTLLIVLSARGFPLGVHGTVGAGSLSGEADQLYGDLTSTPALLRWPDGSAASDRSSALAQPADLSATLLDFWRLPGAVGQIASPPYRVGGVPRDRAAIVSPSGERALRTPAWYARFPSPDSVELYAKPDDRWEINDVARRCPAVVEAMRRALGEFESACASEKDGGELPALDDILVHGPR